MRHCIICFHDWLLITLRKLWHQKVICNFSNWYLIETLFFHASTYWNLVNIYWWGYWFLLLKFNLCFCCFLCCFFYWRFYNLSLLRKFWHLKFFSSTNRLFIVFIFILTSNRYIIYTLNSSCLSVIILFQWFSNCDSLLFIFCFFHSFRKSCWWFFYRLLNLLSFFRKLRILNFLTSNRYIIHIRCIRFLFNFLCRIINIDRIRLLIISIFSFLILFRSFPKPSRWFF